MKWEELLKKTIYFFNLWFRFLASGYIGDLYRDSSFQQCRKNRENDSGYGCTGQVFIFRFRYYPLHTDCVYYQECY